MNTASPASHGGNHCVAPEDPGAQATYILDKIVASLTAAGSRIEDVVRTRIYLRDAAPPNTLVEAKLVGDYAVEIEADAIVSSAGG